MLGARVNARALRSARSHRLLSTRNIAAPDSSAEMLASLRQLMRYTAQPVSVVSTSLASPGSVEAGTHNHGATLSSFSSTSFNPALVAFSLRLPSRLATAFLEHEGARFQVHLLEAGQEELAKLFARQHVGDAEGGFTAESFRQLRTSALGTLDCQIASTLHLDQMQPDFAEEPSGKAVEVRSCLFVARVLQVAVGDVGGRPLVWHNQQYTSIASKAE